MKQAISLVQSIGRPARTLRVLGSIGVAGGAFLYLLSPLELMTFTYFSEGGRFHYPGFSVGSFMGLTITAQVVVYSLVGMIAMAVGYGHLRLRGWIRPVMRALVYTWLIIGFPLCPVAFFILAGTKDLNTVSGILVIGGLVLSYSLFPALLLRYYDSAPVRTILEQARAEPGILEAFPVPIMALVFMGVILTTVFNLLILSNGILPFFGQLLSGKQGVVGLAVCIGWIALVTWGNTLRSRWAWWGTLLLVGFFGVSCLITFSMSSYAEILTAMNFPPYEIQMLSGIPAQGYHFAILSGLPLALMWGLAFRSRRYYS